MPRHTRYGPGIQRAGERGVQRRGEPRDADDARGEREKEDRTQEESKVWKESEA